LAQKPWLWLRFAWRRLEKSWARAKAMRSQGQAKASGLSHGLGSNFHGAFTAFPPPVDTRASSLSDMCLPVFTCGDLRVHGGSGRSDQKSRTRTAPVL
jgi:hypothetical protein